MAEATSLLLKVVMALDPNHLGSYQPEGEGLPGFPQGPQLGNDQQSANRPTEPIEIINGDTRFLQFPDNSIAIGQANELSSPEMDQDDHFQNLAKALPEDIVRKIGNELKNAVEEDVESQSQYFEAVADAIRLLGLNLDGDLSREDLPFTGASSIVSTALFESLLDMLATATSSLYPPTGMVDSVIQGESDEKLNNKAYAKKAFFNYFLTQVAKEFKKEGRRTIAWAILTGSCYKKVYIDPALQRPTSLFIRPEDFIVNSIHSTHLTANRKTHIIRMNGRDLKIRMMSGRYRDEQEIRPESSYQTEDGPIASALQEITGIDHQHYSVDLDTEYVLYEIHCDYYIKDDPAGPDFDLPMPYIITIDKESGYVLDILRNWDKDDFLRKKKEYFVNYSFLPALEGEGYGLVHYAGKLAESATAIKRQLINTATYANFPGGVYAAGIRVENNNLRPAPGEFVPLQTGGTPINQTIMPLPYKEPSATLGVLLTQIEDSIKKPSAMITQKVADMTPQAPMGSVLAMLESLHKIPNAILEGFHESFGQELMLLNSRFAEWLPPGMPYPFKVPGGQGEMMREDFNDDIRVIPASNPALQNSTYRFMQSEIILNQARQTADIHNIRFAYEYFYKNLGLSPEDISQLLPAPQETPPFSGDPLTENVDLMTGKPVTATLQQEHDAHMTVHSLIMNNPQATPEVQAAAQAHIQEHEAMKFLVDMQMQLGIELPADPSQLPPEIQNQIAVAAAQIAAQQLEALRQQQEPPPPPAVDPSVAAMEIEQMRVQQRRESDVNKHEIEKMKLALQQSKLSMDIEIQKMKLDQARETELLRQDFESQREQMRLQQQQESDLMKANLEQKKMDIAQINEMHKQSTAQLNSIPEESGSLSEINQIGE